MRSSGRIWGSRLDSESEWKEVDDNKFCHPRTKYVDRVARIYILGR